MRRTDQAVTSVISTVSTKHSQGLIVEMGSKMDLNCVMEMTNYLPVSSRIPERRPAKRREHVFHKMREKQEEKLGRHGLEKLVITDLRVESLVCVTEEVDTEKTAKPALCTGLAE